MSETHIEIEALKKLVAQAFEVSNVSPANAASVAQALTLAEIDGRKGHGLSRVPSYTVQAKSGKVDGQVQPKLTQTADGSLLVDAASGFAYPAFDLIHKRLPDMASKTGIAVAGVTRSHHFGVAGHQVERAADNGLVAIAFGNTPKAMAPWGGQSALFGTNPIAFAAPRLSGPPMVIDLALSRVARGNIMKASQKGETIPEDWAFDADGNPTTDPEAVLDGGTMAPLGGAKGAALALMVEILAAGLPNANFAYEASSFFTPDGSPPGVGQLLIVIDPGLFGQSKRVLQRIEDMCMAIEAEPGARIPGAGRIELRNKASQNGISVDADLLDQIRQITA
jgi:(2R)-3-sulfolactate dehydrogenase (NADP+)